MCLLYTIFAHVYSHCVQYINNKLVGVEHFVSAHPWGITFFVISGVVVLALFIRRIIREENALADDYSRKARLD